MTFQDNTLDSLIIPQQVCWKALLTCSQVSQSLFAQLYYSMWILARASCGSLKLFLQKHGDFADRMDQVSMRQVWAVVNESLQHREQSHHSIQPVKPDSACCMSECSQDSLILSHIPSCHFLKPTRNVVLLAGASRRQCRSNLCSHFSSAVMLQPRNNHSSCVCNAVSESKLLMTICVHK